jgi:hypothetical protein
MSFKLQHYKQIQKKDQKQDLHTDYQLQGDVSPTDLAWTAHIPIDKDEGSFFIGMDQDVVQQCTFQEGIAYYYAVM